MKLTAVALCLLGGNAVHVIADDSQPLAMYSFENSNMTDDSGRYGFSLFSDAMLVTTKDGNHVLSTGKANGYLDFGEALAREVLTKLQGDYTVSIDLYVGADHALGIYPGGRDCAGSEQVPGGVGSQVLADKQLLAIPFLQGAVPSLA